MVTDIVTEVGTDTTADAGNGHSADDILRWAAAAERQSEHPLAAAIVQAAEDKNLPPGSVADVQIKAGIGLQAKVDGHDIVALERIVASLPLHSSKPSVVICHTTKGKGFSVAEGRAEWHHKSGLSDTEIAALYESLE